MIKKKNVFFLILMNYTILLLRNLLLVEMLFFFMNFKETNVLNKILQRIQIITVIKKEKILWKKHHNKYMIKIHLLVKNHIVIKKKLHGWMIIR
jgi:hypothetical protein